MTPPRLLDFTDVRLYWVTPSIADGRLLLDKAGRALAGGVDAIQLRVKEMADRALVLLGKEMAALCRKAGALFLIDNRPDIALAVEADGVHVGHEDLPIAFVREMIGHRRIIGASTHSLPRALDAQRQGADYVSCGPIWATPTKPDTPAVGLGLIALYQAALKVPFVAIGGINEANIDEVRRAGAERVAVVRAIFDAADAAAMGKNLKAKLEGVLV